MVTEQSVQIRTADGTAEAFVIQPGGAGRWPGVLHLSDIHGVREAHLQLSRRIAMLGYVVLAPNVFYRTGSPPLFEFTPVRGEERTMKRFADLSGPLTPDAMERDAAAYVDFLAAEPSLAPGPMAVVGHCFTGAMALRTAAVRPDRIAAAASLHGARLVTDSATSPHLALPRVKARLYFGHATNDRSMPPDAIATLEQALAEWNGAYESDVYAGAAHGWTMPDSAAYDAAQAERAFESLKRLFAAAL